jgi:dihydrofolate reductase
MKAIIACDPSGGIGYKNKLPWDNIQGDLPRFLQLTKGQVIVMGRNTWESLPKKPLPSRLHFVVSNNECYLPPGAMCVTNLAHFEHFTNAWLIGGAQLINSNWDMIDEIHLTRTTAHYACDAFIDLDYVMLYFECTLDEQHTDHSYQIWKRK